VLVEDGVELFELDDGVGTTLRAVAVLTAETARG
jgi:hypothetical protein